MSLENLNSTEVQATEQETKIQAVTAEEAKSKLAEIQKQNDFLNGKSDTVKEKFYPKIQKNIADLKAGIDTTLNESEDMELIAQLDEVIKGLEAIQDSTELVSESTDIQGSEELVEDSEESTEEKVKVNSEQQEKIVAGLENAKEKIDEVKKLVKENGFLDKHKVKIIKAAIAGILLLGGSNLLNDTKSVKVGEFTMDKTELKQNTDMEGRKLGVELALKSKEPLIKVYKLRIKENQEKFGSLMRDKSSFQYSDSQAIKMVESLSKEDLEKLHDILNEALEKPEKFGLDKNSENFFEEAINKLELNKVFFGKFLSRTDKKVEDQMMYSQANGILLFMASDFVLSARNQDYSYKYSDKMEKMRVSVFGRVKRAERK